MSESITTYELRDLDIPVPMDRDKFYDEQIRAIKKIGKAVKAIEIIAVLLFNKDREIILQKRSHDKKHNPYLIDKTVGGHIKYGESPIYTTMVETVQELRVPSLVLRSTNDFKQNFDLLNGYLDNIAIIKELDKGMFDLERIIDGEKYIIPHVVHLYIGVYGGATKPVDREASGVLYYDLEILKKEMKAQPDNFTKDLHMYLKKYEKEIQDFLVHFD